MIGYIYQIIVYAVFLDLIQKLIIGNVQTHYSIPTYDCERGCMSSPPSAGKTYKSILVDAFLFCLKFYKRFLTKSKNACIITAVI